MEAAAVDPRDTRWEVDSPTYRVYFWSHADDRPGVPAAQAGWRSDEWRLTGALDVHEVLMWADKRSDGRSYTLHAEIDTDRGVGLLHLAGIDPTRMR